MRRRREDDEVTLAFRISTAQRERPARGALKRDLAAALVRTVRPSGEEVFLDPFAGSGAIPQARARYRPRLIYASDIDPERVGDLEIFG